MVCSSQPILAGAICLSWWKQIKTASAANKHNKYLIERGSKSWLEDLLGSSCPGLLRKLLWGPGRPQASCIYGGWGLPDFLQDVTGRRAQGCPPLAHLHSPGLHPWLHQTDPHLNSRKRASSDITCVRDAQNHSENSKQCVLYLRGFQFWEEVPWLLFFLKVLRMDQLLRRL